MQNVEMLSVCHELYEEQIANFKIDMSLAIQVNPINSISICAIRPTVWVFVFNADFQIV